MGVGGRGDQGGPDFIVFWPRVGGGLEDNRKQTIQGIRYSSSSKVCKGPEKLVVATTYRTHGPRPHGQPATLGLLPLVSLPLEGSEGASIIRISIGWVVGWRSSCVSSFKACRKACLPPLTALLVWQPVPSGPLPLVSRWRPGGEGASNISISSMVDAARGEGKRWRQKVKAKGGGQR